MSVDPAIRKAAVRLHTRSRREKEGNNEISFYNFALTLLSISTPRPPPLSIKFFCARSSIWRSNGLPGSKEEMQASHWMIVICGGQKKIAAINILERSLLQNSKPCRRRESEISWRLEMNEMLVRDEAIAMILWTPNNTQLVIPYFLPPSDV